MIARVRCTVLAAAVLVVACGEKKEAPTAAPPASPPAAAAPPAPSTPTPPSTPPAPSSAPSTPTAPPTTTPTAPAPAPATPTATKPAPPPASPAPPASAHAKVGPEKCKMCHRVQYESWAASPHHEKGLDCEGCHGNGGDYWSAAVMRDPAKAKAAGLVLPDLAACRRCHGAKADAALLARVHAHKPK
jgi:hypothetical protein